MTVTHTRRERVGRGPKKDATQRQGVADCCLRPAASDENVERLGRAARTAARCDAMPGGAFVVQRGTAGRVIAWEGRWGTFRL